MADAAYYLKIGFDSKWTVRGNSKDKDHSGWIDIVSYGEGTTKGLGGPGVASDMSFTYKLNDHLIYRDLLTAFYMGRRFDRAILHAVIASGHWWDFREVTIPVYQPNQGDGMDMFSMNFESVQYHDGSPVLETGAAAALLSGLAEGATVVARHMLRRQATGGAEKK